MGEKRCPTSRPPNVASDKDRRSITTPDTRPVRREHTPRSDIVTVQRGHTPRPDTAPRKADKSWLPPKRRSTSHLTNAEDVLPRSLDPMYQGMKRTSTVAKHALFANYRAEVNLHRSIDHYNNICREEVMNIRHSQRQLSRDYYDKQRRRTSIQRARSAPVQPRPVEERKYSYTIPKRPSTLSGRSTPDTDSDSDDSIPFGRNRPRMRPNIRPMTAPRPSFFMTDEQEMWPVNQKRKRPMTAMDLINDAQPLPSRLDAEDIDQDRVRTSSYYRRVTSPSLRGVVSNELAAYFRRMRIKV